MRSSTNSAKGWFCLLVCYTLLHTACSTVLITGRRQLSLIPTSQLSAVSSEAYREFIAAHEVNQNISQAKLVSAVGNRIRKAVETYHAERGMSGELSGYEWEFNVIEDPKVNASCMPGGKVAVYAGIIPVAKTEAGLAAVVSHEIAHAVARHANERLSHELLIRFGTSVLSDALSKHPERTRQLVLMATGLGTEVGVQLPYSRAHELEADRLGLVFMAMAGYDPRSALDFWERMLAVEKTHGVTPEFLSTHPSSTRRIKHLEQWMPEAVRYYRQNSE